MIRLRDRIILFSIPVVMALLWGAMSISFTPQSPTIEARTHAAKRSPTPPIVFTATHIENGQPVFTARSPSGSVTFHRDRVVFALAVDAPAARGKFALARDGNGRKYHGEREDTPPRIRILTMLFDGMNPGCRLEGSDSLPSTLTVFRGSYSAALPSVCPQYGRIRYRDVYPGIDLEYYGMNGTLKYEFLVHPGADASRIRIRYEGQDSLSIDDDGNLRIHAGGLALKDDAPRSLIHGENGDIIVRSSYLLRDTNVNSYSVVEYDHSFPLTIDPGYTVFFGGSIKDICESMTIGNDGKIYIIGRTLSPDIPTSKEAYQRDHRGDFDLFISVLNSGGDSLIASTLIGTSELEWEGRIILDPSGNIIVTGTTYASDYPTTADAMQRQFGGGACDGVISILDPLCKTLLYSTYLGGNRYDQIYGLTTDADGNIYVTGLTDSRNYPVTAGAYQRIYSGGEDDVFITKLSPGAKQLIYSTFLGGSDWDEGYAITLDPDRNAIVCGFTRDDNFPTTPGAFQSVRPGWDDGFVSKISADGTRLIYSTYLGADDNNDVCWDLASDDSGGVFVTGFTDSSNFPTTDSCLQKTKSTVHSRDGFISHLHTSGSKLLACTYFGKPGEPGSIEVLDVKTYDGLVCITGSTFFGRTFPVTRNGGSDSMRGEWDGFISILSLGLDSLIYSGLVGGDGDDNCIAVCFDRPRIVVCGPTTSDSDFHKTNGIVKKSDRGLWDVMIVVAELESLLQVHQVPNHDPDYSLWQSYPNPVYIGNTEGTPMVIIPFHLSRPASAILEVCSVSGRIVERRDFGMLAPGPHQHVMSTKALIQGVYFYRLTVGKTSSTRKFVVL
jgi:hypothetical protein